MRLIIDRGNINQILILAAICFLTSCAGKVLSATFDESAAIVRDWGDACINRNFSDANKYLSATVVHQIQACIFLSTYQSDLNVVAVEDQGTFMNSGELFMVIEDLTTGKRSIITVFLSNSEHGPVILNALCGYYDCSNTDTINWYYPISHSQNPDIIGRAGIWINDQVVYSMTGRKDGYRTDCSGFVSYSWKLEENGRPVSPDTVSLGNKWALDIPYSALRPGDIINNKRGGNQGHVVLFVEWLDSENTNFRAYEENGGLGKAVETQLTLVERSGQHTILEYDSIAPGPYYAQRSIMYP